MSITHITPAIGFMGLVENWLNDLLAAFSVSLVALPLSKLENYQQKEVN